MPSGQPVQLIEFTDSNPMPDPSLTAHAYLEVTFSNRPWQMVSIVELPFLIGRGSESGNHLALDDMRVSRKCAAISAVAGGLRIEDRGQLNGVFVNGEPATANALSDGDRIRLGIDDGAVP